MSTDLKKTYIQIRVTEKEKELLLKMAGKENKTITRFILERVLPEKFEWERKLEANHS